MFLFGLYTKQYRQQQCTKDSKAVKTLASATALSGRKMRGNAYMAPITSLHRTPSIAFSVSVVIRAFSASSPSTWFFSYRITRQHFIITHQSSPSLSPSLAQCSRSCSLVPSCGNSPASAFSNGVLQNCYMVLNPLSCAIFQ